MPAAANWRILPRPLCRPTATPRQTAQSEIHDQVEIMKAQLKEQMTQMTGNDYL